MVLLLVFMQLTRDLFAIAKFLLSYAANRQTNRQTEADVLLMRRGNNNSIIMMIIIIIIVVVVKPTFEHAPRSLNSMVLRLHLTKSSCRCFNVFDHSLSKPTILLSEFASLYFHLLLCPQFQR